MGFSIRQFAGQAGDRTGPVYELAAADGSARAEVWPMCGFNCLRWQVRQADESWGSILFTMPDWETNPVPTRSGHPILFPFPGRLRDGRLDANGKSYQLPLNDSTKQHAIHGFTPRNAWRVGSLSARPDSASIGGLFDLQHDLPTAVGQWPADFELGVAYRLFADRLAVEATVANRGSEPLPFGLGYHPYFRLPGVADADVGGHVLQANVKQVWEADSDNLPTGAKRDLPPELDFRAPKDRSPRTPRDVPHEKREDNGRAIGSTVLDHVFTGITTSSLELADLAVLSHPQATGRLRILADAAFRELVLFTPAHRRAVAIEPYTCSADASNLAARGLDTGWQTLPPGQRWSARVEYRWEKS